ncbi:S9 family peptidase [Paraburkholderia sediminicola]|uniref:S9 family peptidase n=1 Tax=Paraburkholderia sediminicola TaxID=458836 RepID=UPI0038BA92C7
MKTLEQRYEVARKLLNLEESNFVRNGEVFPCWLPDGDQFWYMRTEGDDTEYRLVDAADGRNHLLVKRSGIVAALSERLKRSLDARRTFLANFSVHRDGASVSFKAFGKMWRYEIVGGGLVEESGVPENRLLSPDGKTAVFQENHNLHLVHLSQGGGADVVKPLTFDGVEDNAYAVGPLSMRVGAAANRSQPDAIWSPDSQYVFTFQVDERDVPAFPYTEFAPISGGRSVAASIRTSLPGDEKVTTFRFAIIDVNTGRSIEPRYPRSSVVRMASSPIAAGLCWWNSDSKKAYIVDIERGEKDVHVVEVDVASGGTRELFTEAAETYVELGTNVYTPAAIAPLPESNELIWYSERSGRGHLYLYDLTSGELKHPVTHGAWQVREIVDVDAERREVFFTAAGINAAEDPYICKPCIANIDTGEITVVSDSPGEHFVWKKGEFNARIAAMMRGIAPDQIRGLSPNGMYFVETIGEVTRLPETVLRHRDGREIAIVERAEANLPTGWEWPDPVELLADDGETRIFGLLFKPFDFDPAKTYPLIDYIYGGPQVAHVPKQAFGDFMQTGSYSTAASFAAIGAYCLILDGRGTAYREKAFREASHRAAESASNLKDHIAGIRQLAEIYRNIDLTKIGIAGFSGGGYMSAIAALRHGDFFKVAVAGGGNYDQALFMNSWGERYHGPYEAAHYAKQAAKTYAKQLTGKLLLVHGMMDYGCHPAPFFQLVQSLIDANRDFDQLTLPRAGHEMPGYALRRRLDYFVTHLFGDVAPSVVAFSGPSDSIIERMKYSATLPEDEAAVEMVAEEFPSTAGAGDV